METREKIPVYIDTKDGRTVCICHAWHKNCGKDCARDTIIRDRFHGWESTMKRNRYGQ